LTARLALESGYAINQPNDFSFAALADAPGEEIAPAGKAQEMEIKALLKDRHQEPRSYPSIQPTG